MNPLRMLALLPRAEPRCLRVPTPTCPYGEGCRNSVSMNAWWRWLLCIADGRWSTSVADIAAERHAYALW